MVALVPYLLFTNLSVAAYGSILLASIALFAAGGPKARATGQRRWCASAAKFFVLGMIAIVGGYFVGVVLRSFV